MYGRRSSEIKSRRAVPRRSVAVAASTEMDVLYPEQLLMKQHDDQWQGGYIDFLLLLY